MQFLSFRVARVACRVSPRQATFFSLRRQRKEGKRKATPLSASLRFASGNLRCSQNGGDTQTRFAQTRVSLIPVLLRCSAHTEGEVRIAESDSRTSKSNKGAPWRVLVVLGICLLHFAFTVCAVMRRREAQVQTDQGWRCLSEASLARPRLRRASQCARAAGRRIRLAFLLGTFLWRSKEKYLARRGETRHAPRGQAQLTPTRQSAQDPTP
jgi:hypothetical protein